MGRVAREELALAAFRPILIDDSDLNERARLSAGEHTFGIEIKGANPSATPANWATCSDTASAANGYTRAALEAASRAVYQCQPYRLPQDRYNDWREINPLRFDPRQMMGQ